MDDFNPDSGSTEADLPDHLTCTSAIVDNLKMIINGQTLFDISHYNHLAVYTDLDIKNADMKMSSHTSSFSRRLLKRNGMPQPNVADDTLASIHKDRYDVSPLMSFLVDATFGPQAIHNTVSFQPKLARGKYNLNNI